MNKLIHSNQPVVSKMKHQRHTTQKGFTLIEMLVAVLMIGILFVLVFGAIDSATDSREATAEAADDLVDLNRAFIWLSQDLNSFVNRPIRDSFGTEQPAMKSGEAGLTPLVSFTRSGWPVFGEQVHSDLARVAYELKEEKRDPRAKADDKDTFSLYRVYWRDADRPTEEPSRKRRIIKGVYSFSIRYMDSKRNWKDEWPPLNQQGVGNVIAPPRALEINLELKDWGKLRRVFRVVEGHGF